MNNIKDKPKKPSIRVIAANKNHEARTGANGGVTATLKARTCLLILLLAAVSAGSSWFDCRFFSIDAEDNVLDAVSPLPSDNVNWKRVEKYVCYLVDNAKTSGIQSISEKWAETVPERLKKLSENRLEQLVQRGFVVSEISLDLKGIYNVRCEIGDAERESVFFDVVKEKIEDSQVFRIVRIY
jgi:hypothetical protein